MTVRTTKKTVFFSNPFTLGEFGETFPAGAYEVESDEERLEGLSFLAYRRTFTLIHVPVKSGRPGLSRTLKVDPDALEAALKRDAAPGSNPTSTPASTPTPTSNPLERPIRQWPSKAAPKAREAEADSRAVDRAEDEGMIVHPQ